MSSSIEEVIQSISIKIPKRIVVLTGAGISAESGVPTFRGSGGLWESYRPEELATPEAFARDPKTVWRWYEWRRSLVRKAEPNRAHFALATLEQALVVTQNVDGLHQRAGSRNVIELHGSMFRVRCIREATETTALEEFPEVPPKCSCGGLLRPAVVWFGEPLPEKALADAANEVAAADLLLVVGTSGIVYPAAGLVGVLRHGISVEINPQATPLTNSCDFSIRASAVEAVPPLVDAILRSRP